MARRKRKAASSSRTSKKKSSQFKVGQRVQIGGYGEGTVIAVEARRGGRYSDVWVQPDEYPEQEIGVKYQHELIEPT